MKLRKFTIWASGFAGVLFVIGGLRDLLAPGFFKPSQALPSKGEIAFQFVLGAVFLTLAVLTNKSKNQPPAPGK
jgi:hypothetical protein